MKKNIFIVHNRLIAGEEAIVAVFDNGAQAEAFTRRNRLTEGKYEVTEHELNPFFIHNGQQPYRIILHPGIDPVAEVIPIVLFDEEMEAFQEAVTKVDESFHVCLFADDDMQAETLARERYAAMVASGEWMMMADITDQDDED